MLDDAFGVPLTVAQRIVEAAREEAVRQGAAVSIAVVDCGGHLLHFSRMDRIHVGTVAVAQAKARTAALYNRATKDLAAGLASGNTALLTLPDLVALPGGVPVASVNGVVAGAIGVSGAAPDVDEAIARAGIAAMDSKEF